MKWLRRVFFSGLAILLPPFPNPANPRVSIPLRIAEPAHLRAAIYDLQGRMLRTLLDGMVTKIEAEQPLTDTEKGLLAATALPVYKYLTVSAAFLGSTIQSDVDRYAATAGDRPGSAYGYRDKEEEARYLERDALKLLTAQVQEQGLIDPPQIHEHEQRHQDRRRHGQRHRDALGPQPVEHGGSADHVHLDRRAFVPPVEHFRVFLEIGDLLAVRPGRHEHNPGFPCRPCISIRGMHSPLLVPCQNQLYILIIIEKVKDIQNHTSGVPENMLYSLSFKCLDKNFRACYFHIAFLLFK